MYKVIKRFKDLQDDNYVYNTGDLFPREGLVVSEDRINELLSSSNLIGEPIIEHIEEASSLTEEGHQESEADETPSDEGEAKEKPRRRKKNDD